MNLADLDALTEANPPVGAPPLPVRLACRFGCRGQAAFLISYPAGCICYPDRIQALCEQHAVKGLQNNDGRIIARLRQEVGQ